jgi:hypothetical protein
VKLIFLHVPKSAGTSLRKVLGDISPPNKYYNCDTPLLHPGGFEVIAGHFTWRQVCTFCGFKVITVLRDPVDAELSFLNWVDTQLKHGGETSIEYRARHRIAERSMDRYIECCAQDGKVTEIFSDGSGQWNKLCGVIESMDLVGFTDKMETFASRLSEMTGKEIHLPILNKSEKRFELNLVQRLKMREALRNDVAFVEHAHKHWS